MSSNSSFILAIIILLIVAGLAVLFFALKRKEKHESDYRAFFMLGTTWLPLGIVLYASSDNMAFLGMGIIFLTIGLANRDKWKEPKPLENGQKKTMVGLLATGMLAFLFILTIYYLSMKGS